MDLILHSERNKNAFMTLIAAEYCGVKVDLVKNFDSRVACQNSEFRALNPAGKIPALQIAGDLIVESTAIARHVARLKGDNALFGSSLSDYVHVEQWIDFASLEIAAPSVRLLQPHCNVVPPHLAGEKVTMRRLLKSLRVLDTYLASHSFLVGRDVSFADIIMTCNLYFGITKFMHKSFTKVFPHVEKYFWNMVCQPNFKKIIGEVKQQDGPKEETPVAEPSDTKKAKKAKEEAPVAEQSETKKAKKAKEEAPATVENKYYDTELEEPKKVDINNEAQKERVSWYLKAEPFDG